MSNERLRAAIDKAGLTPDQLAQQVGVDPKTVYRWISGRPPRKTARVRVANTTGVAEAEIWPEEELRVDGRDQAAEILAAYAHTNDPDTPDWRALLARASQHVDLVDLTLTDLINQPRVLDLLAEKSRSDCEVRLLLSAPESAHLTLTDSELGAELNLMDIAPSAIDADHTLTQLAPRIAQGAQIRTYIAARPNRMLRFDDEMLITLTGYGTAIEDAPLLHIQRHSDHGLYNSFADQVDRLWDSATPVPA